MRFTRLSRSSLFDATMSQYYTPLTYANVGHTRPPYTRKRVRIVHWWLRGRRLGRPQKKNKIGENVS